MMPTRGRRTPQPRFVASGRENGTPRAPTAEKKPESLRECAERTAKLIAQKIEDSTRVTDEMRAAIARCENDARKRQIGFKTKLRCKRDELAAKHNAKIESVQSLAAVELAETEQLASQIASLTNELEELGRPRQVAVPDIGPIDFSKKTQKELNIRQAEMEQKCRNEFGPLFEQLQQKHQQDVDELNQKYSERLAEIERECQAEIDGFAPKTFATRAEMKHSQAFESRSGRQKSEYEKKRDSLKEQINKVERQRDAELQRITDETDDQIFQGEQLLGALVQKVRDSVVEPPLPELPDHVELPPEQEQVMRQKIELSLKADFEMKLKSAIAVVADQREDIQAAADHQFERELADGERSLRLKIEDAEGEMLRLQTDIKAGVDEIHRLKAEWTDLNHTRNDHEDLLAKLRAATCESRYRLDQLQDNIQKLGDSEADDDDGEADAIQEELGQLAQKVASAKRYHVNATRKRDAAHAESVAQIKNRVRSVAEKKDELIARLKSQIRETKSRIRTVDQQMRLKLDAYRDS
jgi:hypothetical protein